jgi:hypothetical protein
MELEIMVFSHGGRATDEAVYIILLICGFSVIMTTSFEQVYVLQVRV